jgi:hypothetical protein
MSPFNFEADFNAVVTDDVPMFASCGNIPMTYPSSVFGAFRRDAVNSGAISFDLSSGSGTKSTRGVAGRSSGHYLTVSVDWTVYEGYHWKSYHYSWSSDVRIECLS